MEHLCNKALKLNKNKNLMPMGGIWIYILLKYTKNENIISKLLSRNCAGWNPVKRCRYKQHPYIIKMKERKKEIERNWNIEGENGIITKNLAWKILLELSFFISPGLKYFGRNLCKCESKT